MTKLTQILNNIQYSAFFGDSNCEIDYPKQFDVENTDANTIMWLNDKSFFLLDSLNYGTVICTRAPEVKRPTVNYILVNNPRFAFKTVLELFFVDKVIPSISKTSVIHPSVKIGVDALIGENVVIEGGCEIGNSVQIDHNSVIKKNTRIGNNVKIGSCCTIGGVGFGYEKDIEGEYSLIPHLGNVVLNDRVEIGNNTCIDRGVLGSTILEENVKVDNLVHIAHGVKIGANSLIIANSMIAGSVTIGENVWVAPSSSILNKKSVGTNSTIGMGAVVVKNVEVGQVIVGNPGKPLIK